MSMKRVNYFMDLFLCTRFFIAGGLCVLLFLFSFFLPWLFLPTIFCCAVFVILFLADYTLTFFFSPLPLLQRELSARFSNGDPNTVTITLQNRMNFNAWFELIDELPEQFQIRDFSVMKLLPALKEVSVNYQLTPTERGLYSFGNTRVFLYSPFKLLSRRITYQNHTDIAVYPSYQQLHHVNLLALASHRFSQGSGRMRKLGQSMEFEQIKEYVSGDDVRTVNWKATARRGAIMVNRFSEERSQQIYCILDKGRLMKMPFEGLTLLDYAINSTLVLAHVCLQKQDKIGLISFAEKMGVFLPAERKPIQRENMLNALYKQQTAFLEPDFEMLYMQVRQMIRQRSLLLLFTNFETLAGARRQIPYLRSLAKYHLLLVIFFENTELKQVANAEVESVEDIYVQTIAEKFLYEKRLIVKELSNHGILSILSTPQSLTVNTVNKYLELKSRQAI